MLPAEGDVEARLPVGPAAISNRGISVFNVPVLGLYAVSSSRLWFPPEQSHSVKTQTSKRLINWQPLKCCPREKNLEINCWHHRLARDNLRRDWRSSHDPRLPKKEGQRMVMVSVYWPVLPRAYQIWRKGARNKLAGLGAAWRAGALCGLPAALPKLCINQPENRKYMSAWVILF